MKITSQLAILFVAVAYSPCALAAPSTAQFMNAMTVCAAGSQVDIDANLQGSLTSIYNDGVTKGKARQVIATEIQKNLPQGDTYKMYLDCLKQLVLSQ